MKAQIQLKDKTISVDFSKPLDISIPMRAGIENVNAWYVDPVKIEPVKGEGFIGAVAQGGSVNFRDIDFNPHGNGTHTECVGHIAPTVFSVNKALTQFFFDAQLITIIPTVFEGISSDFQKNGDLIISEEAIKKAIGDNKPQAIVIRTTPNLQSKINAHYSSTNPAYIEYTAASWLREIGVKHLLIDLPSVDRESDAGKLMAHRAFWNYPENPVMEATITELIYVANTIKDGLYLLNLQMASFENDASPSKPVLYAY
jgi:arylformamidase